MRFATAPNQGLTQSQIPVGCYQYTCSSDKLTLTIVLIGSAQNYTAVCTSSNQG